MHPSIATLGAAAIALLLSLAACEPTGSGADDPEGDADAADESPEAVALADAVIESITTEGLERHARAIVQYERPSGSPGENAAIDSIVASLEADGVPVEVHTFDTYASDPVSAEVRVPSAGLTLDAITMAYSGPATGLEGRLVDVGSLGDLPGLEVGTGERLALEGATGAAADLPDLEGAIVVVEGQPRNVPTAVLALLGAESIVFTNPEDRLNDLIVTSTWGTPSLRNYHRLPEIPAVQVTRSDGDRLRELMAAGPVTAQIDAEVSTGRKELRLAVARIDGPTAEAPYVLLGGHIDGWYHGATDEGASNAAMVELAKAFHEHRDRMRRGLVVAWWPGHSNARYAGSTWFADHFFEELRDRAVAYLNIDGVGQIDAVRLSSTATASMGALARQVVGAALDDDGADGADAADESGAGGATVGDDGLRVSTPGRNSDQSFNGVGMPLLQFNHSRSQEDGGYWWWHTPDDTFDKIDFDILRTDAGLYARAIARLTVEPVLPVDLVAEVEALGAEIAHRSEQSGGRFDLGEAAARHDALLTDVRELAPMLEGPELTSRFEGADASADLDGRILAVLRPVYRVMYAPVDPFHPDPGLSLGLLPGLAPVTILAEEAPTSDRYLFAETTLVRERNRLLEALDRAIAAADDLRADLER